MRKKKSRKLKTAYLVTDLTITPIKNKKPTGNKYTYFKPCEKTKPSKQHDAQDNNE